MPHPLLIFDCSEDMFYRDFEQDELLFFSVALHLVARRLLVDGTGSLIRALIGSNRLWLRLFPFTALFGGAIGCPPGRVLNLDILLDLK